MWPDTGASPLALVGEENKVIEGTQARKLAIFLAAALVLIFAMVAAACSSGSGGTSAPDQTAEEQSDSEQPTATEPANSDAGSTPTDPLDGPSSSPSDSIAVEARDSVFDVQPSQGVPGTIEAPANSDVTVKLTNEGTLPHNIAFLTEKGGKVLADGANSNIILEGESTAITFKTPDAGTYYFQCTVHPQEMIGEFIVE